MKIIPVRLGMALYCFLSPLVLFAQTVQKQKSGSAEVQITTCSPEELIGLIKYDSREAAEKVGLDVASASYGKFDRVLQEHSSKVDDLVQKHREVFERLYSLKGQYEEQATAQQDFQPLVKLIQLMEEQLQPIGVEVEKENDYLHILLAHVLEDRQFRKWERYQAKVKKERGPHYPRPMAGPLAMD
ncbi:hypothetical protein J0A68_18065 [Algoriphagus sp. H41]|uniref:DUF4142 domain-containing protein n=1 Tax=Algoriphagus oliviformis TaxID=2811231 RepID=A0ABS3C7A6_9BACT|nr:hypothetical protein [Algoriphagus oliviformis]MBN7812867.1 hypothetical protein [Algoriphagus oliviformis]